MPKTATIRVRIDENTKTEAEAIIRALGLTPSEAINVFYRMIILHRGLPFELRLPRFPNEETAKVIEEVKKADNLEKTSEEEIKKNRSFEDAA